MDISFEGDQVIVQVPKAVLVMTRQQFIEALRRGKAYRRREALAQRLTKSAQDQRGAIGEGTSKAPVAIVSPDVDGLRRPRASRREISEGASDGNLRRGEG